MKPSHVKLYGKKHIRLILCVFAAYFLLVTIPYYTKYQKDGNIVAITQNKQSSRQNRIVDAAIDSFRAYSSYAWGYDELKPLSNQSHNWVGLGLTIIDSLDTLWIMGSTDPRAKVEFQKARDWVEKNFTVSVSYQASLFETTIRVLGGLLSTYHLTGDEMFLKRALEVGDCLSSAFSSKSAIPYRTVSLNTKTASDSNICVAEAGSIQLEFKYLSHLSKNSTFAKLAINAMDHIAKIEPQTSLCPTYLNSDTGEWVSTEVSFGGGGDSYYEYLYKQYYQTGKVEKRYKEMWDRAWTSAKTWLIDRTTNQGLVFIGKWTSGPPSNFNAAPKSLQERQADWNAKKPKQGLEVLMGHLACYLPGTVLLSITEGQTLAELEQKQGKLTDLQKEDLYYATELLTTCYKMYTIHPTKLAQDWNLFRTSNSNLDMSKDTVGDVKYGEDRRNLLRPEFVESLFYFWRITQNATYRDWGWNIWENGFEKYSRVPSTGAFAVLKDVTQSNPVQEDSMETFWMGETLKYFYLLFSDDKTLLPLDQIVFNTEAHPFPIIPKST